MKFNVPEMFSSLNKLKTFCVGRKFLSGFSCSYGASYYRTKWLMSHNALHELVHKTIPDAKVNKALLVKVQDDFQNYLNQLKEAETIASKPA